MPKYKLYHFKSLTSTQDKAREFSRKGLSNAIIVAGTQTRGKGRFKRKWHSGKNGLYMSILLKPKSTKNLQYLTFIAAVSVARSIKKISKLDAGIKWPNDVHYKGKKLCGILTEGIFGKENYVIVGIGLNVNQTKFPEDIKDTATSLKIIKNKNFSIKKLAEHIANEFFNLYKSYYAANKLKDIRKLWEKYCDTINRKVAVITKMKTFNGTAFGIDKNCNLLLRLKNGSIVKIIEGDISVRH